MRKLFLLAFLLAVLPLRAQQVASLSNPQGGSIFAAGATCANANVCVWQKLPITASTTTITITGTFTATLIIETAADGNTFTTSSTQSSPTTVSISTNSLTDVRVRASAYTSGTAFVNISTGVTSSISGGGGGFTITTVAGLAALAVKGNVAAVTNGANSTDCTVGGGTTTVVCQYTGSAWTAVGGTGTGSVTTFSAGTLSPLFTTSVATPTTTPALSFSASTFAANTVFGNFTGGVAAPTASAAPVFSAANLTGFPQWPLSQINGGSAPGGQSYDFTGVTLFKGRVAAGLTTAANGAFGYDSTNNNWHFFTNATDLLMVPLASGFVSGHCGQPTSTTNSWVIADTGSACGSGGSTAWSSLTNPSGNLSLTMAANTSTFNTTTAQAAFFKWANTTAAVVGTSQGSPIESICGTAFHASASVEDCMTLSTLPGNGNDAAIAFNIGHTGSSTGVVTTNLPGPLAIPQAGGVGGMVSMTEGTVPASLGTASQDNCYADSTAHQVLCKDNNGTTRTDTRSPSATTSGNVPTYADVQGNLATGKGVQGTDANFLTAGTISGTSVLLCTDANGGATTSSCPAGGSSALSAITAATGANTIASGNNPQTWNWAQTTNTQSAMTFGETSAATSGTLTNGLANQLELAVSTASASTATPFGITQGSITGTVAFPAAQFQTTWNNASLVGLGLIFNVTDTASNASSLLADLRKGNTSQWKVDKSGNSTQLGAGNFGTSPPACTAGTAGATCFTEGTAFTNVASTAGIYPDSTQHEFFAGTAGASPTGMLVRRQPGAIHQTAQTAAITTATLCAASAGACNVAGQYHIHFTFIETGTACATPGTGGVTFLLTWTDTNATTHSAVSVGFDDASAINTVSQTFHFQTTLAAAWGSGDFNISTNGSVIQYATGYTACTSGTGTYQLDAVVTRLQ